MFDHYHRVGHRDITSFVDFGFWKWRCHKCQKTWSCSIFGIRETPGLRSAKNPEEVLRAMRKCSVEATPTARSGWNKVQDGFLDDE
jgi:hypothetical protein